MIGHDHIQPEQHAVGHRLHITDTAVHRDHQPEAILGQHTQRRRVQAIALLDAVRDVRLDHRAQRAQSLHHQGRRRHTVGVEVAIHGNRLLLTDGLPDACYSLVHIGQVKRVDVQRRALQELARPGRIADSPVVEHLGDHRMKLLQLLLDRRRDYRRYPPPPAQCLIHKRANHSCSPITISKLE